jgi:hypothetical protein
VNCGFAAGDASDVITRDRLQVRTNGPHALLERKLEASEVWIVKIGTKAGAN